MVNFHTIGENLSLKFTKNTVEIISYHFGLTSPDNASFSPCAARCAKGIPSLSELDSSLDFLQCENIDADVYGVINS